MSEIKYCYCNQLSGSFICQYCDSLNSMKIEIGNIIKEAKSQERQRIIKEIESNFHIWNDPDNKDYKKGYPTEVGMNINQWNKIKETLNHE